MKQNLKRRVLLVLAFSTCLLLNYNPQAFFHSDYQHWGWNFSLLASVIIILIIKYRDPENWKQKLGIDFNGKDIFGFLITTAVLIVISFYLVDYVAKLGNYSFKPRIFNFRRIIDPDCPLHTVLGTYAYYIPETFNEEMLIGAILLMGLERRFEKLNRNIIAISVALIFSFMHQALYKYSPYQPGILLTATTISTLFFVGILRNVLILKTRKIAYSWAIHLSFNLVFFAGFFVNMSTGDFASEPERFNIVFGSIIMLLLTGSLATISLIWLNINKGAPKSTDLKYGSDYKEDKGN